MRAALTLILICYCSIRLSAQTWQDTTKLIDNIFSRYQPSQPGCQLAISRHGNIIYSKAWGMADLEHPTALTTTSIIEAGSVSKQFTAAAILLLQSAGKLSLNDDIRQYLPEIPDYGQVITLKHLLHHTSGLKDWGSLMAFSDWPRGTKLYTNDDVLRIVTRQKSLNNKPGAAFFYSNTNYVLLAIIVQKVSGQSLAAFTTEKIFRPLQMNATQWRDDIRRVVPGRAIAYAQDGNTWLADMPYENVYGNGGLLTTAEDLLKWNNAYTHGQLNGPALLQQQLDTTGQPASYAAGLRLVNINGHNAIAHDGATAAYRSVLEYYPDLDLSIAWLANTSAFDDKGDGLNELRDLLFPPIAKVETNTRNSTQTPPKPLILSDKILKAYVGNYVSAEIESTLQIILTGNTLKIKRIKGDIFPLIPVSDHEFQIENSKVKVVFQKNQLYLSSPKVKNIRFDKIKPML